MTEFVYNNLDHVLCGLLLISRLGDVISTYLVSPTLKLEANPIVKRLGWKFALLTILVCVVPYWSLPMGLMMLVPFLMVSASNIGKIWFIRTYGESEYLELVRSVARKGSMRGSLLGTWASAAFIALQGSVLIFFYPNQDQWAFWFGCGILLYALIIALWGTVYTVRLFRSLESQTPAEAPDS